MQRIVINACHGGFSLSIAGMRRYARLLGKTLYVSVLARDAGGKLIRGLDQWVPYDPVRDDRKGIEGQRLDPFFFTCHTRPLTKRGTVPSRYRLSNRDMARDNPALLATVRALGKRAWGSHAELKVVRVPDGVKWCLSEYDGRETVEEEHRSWS